MVGGGEVRDGELKFHEKILTLPSNRVTANRTRV